MTFPVIRSRIGSIANLNVLERWSANGLFVPALQHQLVPMIRARCVGLTQAVLGHPVAPLNLYQYFSIHQTWKSRKHVYFIAVASY